MRSDLLKVLVTPKRRSAVGTLLGLTLFGSGLGIATMLAVAAFLGRPFVVSDLIELPEGLARGFLGSTSTLPRPQILAEFPAQDGRSAGAFRADLPPDDSSFVAEPDAVEPNGPKAEASQLEVASPEGLPGPILRLRPLADWLEEAAKDAARGLVIGPGLDGELRAGALAEISWQDRLAAYARVYGFHYDVGPHLIEVVASRTEPAGDEAKRLATLPDSRATEPSGASEGPVATNPTSAPPRLHRVVRVEHADVAELVAVVRAVLQGTGVALAADPAANSMVVSGHGDALQAALALVGRLDRPRRRVLLETKMVEVSGSAAAELGIEWRIDGDVGGLVRLPAADAPREAAALLLGNAGSGKIEARLGLLESAGRARVVSRPRIVMLEGKPAIIESARILRVRLPGRGAVVGDEVGDVDTGAGRATEEIPVGVRLEVTPRVASDGTVTLKIRAKSSSLGPPLPPDDIPEELSRMVEAEVTVTDGETAVLGGLLRDGRTKAGTGVPILRDVPGIGAIFGKRSTLRESEELLVLVTPRVLP